jgi:hypothetical protein
LQLQRQKVVATLAARSSIKDAPQRKTLQGDRLSLWLAGQYEPRTLQAIVDALVAV